MVLWELLTGHRADDAQELPLPDVRTLNPDVPDELARIVARATALAPQERPRGADELGAALTTFLPAGTDPQQETAALLRSCFDVDTLQPLLAAEIAGAKRLVTGEPVDSEAPPRATTPLRRSVRSPAAVASLNSMPIPRRDRGTAADARRGAGRRRRRVSPSCTTTTTSQRRPTVAVAAPPAAPATPPAPPPAAMPPPLSPHAVARPGAAGRRRGDAALLAPRSRGALARRPRRRPRAVAPAGQ